MNESIDNDDHSLSIYSLLNIINNVFNGNFAISNEFAQKIATYPMVVSNTLKGWNGIDCTICVVLIHLSQKHCSGKKSYFPPEFPQDKIKEIYEKIYERYEKLSATHGKHSKSFCPNIRG